MSQFLGSPSRGLLFEEEHGQFLEGVNRQYGAPVTAPDLIGREMLHAAVAPYVDLYIETLEGAHDSDAEHLQLLDACRAGNIKQATKPLDVHLAEAEQALVSFLREHTHGDN